MKDVYERLRELLDRHPFGCPPAPEISEILRILFTPEEAAVALGLSFAPLSVQEIAARAGVDPQAAAERLESMADKGLAFARKKEGAWGYALNHVVLLFENPYRKGVRNETIQRLTPLWQRYHTFLQAPRNYTPTPFIRAITIDQVVGQRAEVLDYERVYEMIDRAKVVGVTRCACRELWQKCDAPRETCMVFDGPCTYLVDRGFARYLDKEEMKDKLSECDRAGLVRMVNNSRDRLEVICHCCSCCCGLLRGLKNTGRAGFVAQSSVISETDPDQCQGCGVCADKRCPVKAIEMVEERPVVREEQCIGCGLCVTGCPNNARSMRRRAQVLEPPANMAEWGARNLQAQGKLGAFMEVMNPAYRPKAAE